MKKFFIFFFCFSCFFSHAQLIFNNYSENKLKNVCLTQKNEIQLKKSISKPYAELGATFFTPGGINLTGGFVNNWYGVRASVGYTGESAGCQVDFVLNVTNSERKRSGGGVSLGYIKGYNIDIEGGVEGEARGYYIAGQYLWNIKWFFASLGFGYIFYHPKPDVRIVPLISIGINKRFFTKDK